MRRFALLLAVLLNTSLGMAILAVPGCQSKDGGGGSADTFEEAGSDTQNAAPLVPAPPPQSQGISCSELATAPEACSTCVDSFCGDELTVFTCEHCPRDCAGLSSGSGLSCIAEAQQCSHPPATTRSLADCRKQECEGAGAPCQP